MVGIHHRTMHNMSVQTLIQKVQTLIQNTEYDSSSHIDLESARSKALHSKFIELYEPANTFYLIDAIDAIDAFGYSYGLSYRYNITRHYYMKLVNSYIEYNLNQQCDIITEQLAQRLNLPTSKHTHIEAHKFAYKFADNLTTPTCAYSKANTNILSRFFKSYELAYMLLRKEGYTVSGINSMGT